MTHVTLHWDQAVRSVGYHLYTTGQKVYFSCHDPSFWLGQYFIIFLTKYLQSRAQKEKIKTVHLFLNSAKSSEAGNRTEKSKVRAVMSLHEPSRPVAALISDADPFKSHLTWPALSHALWRERGTGAFCQHQCQRPFGVL